MIRLIQRIVALIFRTESDDRFSSDYIIKNSVQLFVLHGVSIAVGFLSNYILIKMAGVADYGSYIYIFNLLSLLSNLCLLGVDALLVKNIAVYDATDDYRKLKGIVIFSIITAVLGSLIIGIVSGKWINSFAIIENRKDIHWFRFALPSLLMLSVVMLNQAFLQGLKKIVLSQLVEKLIKPLILIIGVVILFHFKKGTLKELVWINVFAIAITLAVTSVLCWRHMRASLKKLRPEYDLKGWTRSAVIFFLMGVLYILNSKIDVFFIGLLKGSREVGVYNIILRVSEIISFGLTIINFVLAPMIARLFAQGDFVQLQTIATRSARAVFLIGVLLMGAIIVLRNHILVFFGVDFSNASDALLILCLGQFMNILFGSVGLLLMMSGNERFAILGLFFSVLFNIVFNLVLIPRYGIIGAAITTAGGLTIWNFLMYVFVRKKMNIHPTAIRVF